MINPAIVEGQIRGGVAQGIGEVLYEWSAYDEGRQLFGRYVHGLPATNGHRNTHDRDRTFWRTSRMRRSSTAAVGEGGLLIAPAAITNAIEDALSPSVRR